jgi:hypothetical protein
MGSSEKEMRARNVRKMDEYSENLRLLAPDKLRSEPERRQTREVSGADLSLIP